MQRIMLRSKIHRATITEADLAYQGSLGVDRTLLEAADMLPNERIQFVNLANGARAETYVITGEKGSGDIVMNGAIARMAQVGDRVIILAYAQVDAKSAEEWRPSIVIVDEKNRIIEK